MTLMAERSAGARRSRAASPILLAAFATACGAARAEPATTPPAPSVEAPKPALAASPAAPVLSESKFLSALYAEIARVGGLDETELGEGEVTASFHVDASGKVDKVAIDKSTSPAHAEAVKKLLAAVKAPPAPGGGMDIGQTFKFH